ncbi:MAG: 3-hydroxyacyl-CoA dehydrogenase NAD-binding domain-containing protein [Candidatus Bathyarchaeota archaeon]|nr:3-hydroxyacyl-CoA dehydrogenase NAD-binding domain-containing protein [Candidatus Termiticorpusculum sp.]MCL1970560.1 3-hydroxyacyl-CoA dehydrogenase NAD-binding domain-containing protein [Candidatus Termiticorpusculum sp.]
MSSVLKLQAQDVDSNEKRSGFTVGVIGCGQNGLLYADAFAEAGYRVICNDDNPSLLKRISRAKNCGVSPEIEASLKKHINRGNLTISSVRKSAVAQSDIVILAINAKLDAKNKVNVSELKAAYKQVGMSLRQGSLLIYGGINCFGGVETMLKETLENTSGLKSGKDFLLAYNPLQFSKSYSMKTLSNAELIIAASDLQSLNVATEVLKTLTLNVRQTSHVRFAELAVLFKMAQQDACTALAKELAIFCEKSGMDYFKVQKLISDDGNSSFSPTVDEEENRKGTYLLIESAENFNVKLRLPAISRQINEEVTKYAINLTQETLRVCDKSLRRAKVAVIGNANQDTVTARYVNTAIAKGAKVTLYDPLLSKNETLDGPPFLKKSLNEAVEGVDCLVILTGQKQFEQLNLRKIKTSMKSPALLVDLIGITEPESIQAEGFIYRGIGRGVVGVNLE